MHRFSKSWFAFFFRKFLNQPINKITITQITDTINPSIEFMISSVDCFEKSIFFRCCCSLLFYVAVVVVVVVVVVVAVVVVVVAIVVIAFLLFSHRQKSDPRSKDMLQ